MDMLAQAILALQLIKSTSNLLFRHTKWSLKGVCLGEIGVHQICSFHTPNRGNVCVYVGETWYAGHTTCSCYYHYYCV